MAHQRRGLGALVVVGILVAALVGAYVVADSVLRGYAEKRVRDEITGNLPAGVTGDVGVTIGGTSVIAQYLTGSFDRVEVRAPQLRVNGTLAAVHLVATDVPVDTSRPVPSIRGTIDLGEKSVNTLLQAAGTPGSPGLALGAGDVTYTGTVTAMGFPIDYRATARPEATGGSVIFRPTSAELLTGIGSLDVSGLVQRVLGQQPIDICVAQYLPVGVELTGVDVTPERARLTLQATHLVLSSEAFGTLGSCG